jgi:hypothetical protein
VIKEHNQCIVFGILKRCQYTTTNMLCFYMHSYVCYIYYDLIRINLADLQRLIMLDSLSSHWQPSVNVLYLQMHNSQDWNVMRH